jgi:DNA invertase Pin-like site-specific DNA recombinase
MKNKAIQTRNVALCYIRESYSSTNQDVQQKHDDSRNPNLFKSASNERQIANLQAICDREGWIAKFYEDVGGHKSGRSKKNRNDWKRLEQDLAKPNVVALIGNDMARFHRNSLNMQLLIVRLQELDVKLVLANSPYGEVDIFSPQGRLLLNVYSWSDEMFAEYLSEKAKDSVKFRKKRGITVGMPPFGTQRNAHGYLEPSTDGVWLLNDGTWQKGELGESPPEKNAIWRGYYECTKRILELYSSEHRFGYARISYQLQREGWAFRTRKHAPRNIESHDVKRVVSNVFEYGGTVSDVTAKKRPGYLLGDITLDMFDIERTVFPVQLLFDVAKVRKEKSYKPSRRINSETTHYPLGQILYCAKCEMSSIESGLHTPALGSKKDGKGRMKYFHRQGRKCTCKRKSVHHDIVDQDFTRLLGLLCVNENYLDEMRIILMK